MEQFFTAIFNYLKSPEFTAVATTILAGVTAVMPIINKITSNKTKISLEKYKAQLTQKTAEIQQLETQIIEFGKICDTANATIKELKANSQNQNEAMIKAFNSSNLKQDVKDSIAKILAIKQTVEDIVTPVTAEPTPSNITAELPTDNTQDTTEYERIM